MGKVKICLATCSVIYQTKEIAVIFIATLLKTECHQSRNSHLFKHMCKLRAVPHILLYADHRVYCKSHIF
jgi:hypothetical protein